MIRWVMIGVGAAFLYDKIIAKYVTKKGGIA